MPLMSSDDPIPNTVAYPASGGGYNATTRNPYPTPSSTMDQMLGFYNGLQAPQNEMYKQQQQGYAKQAGDLSTQYGYQGSLLGIGNQFQQQLLGINQQQNQLQQNAIPRQSQYYDLLNQLGNQGYDLSTQAAQQTAGQAKYNAISQGVANGSLMAGGVKRNENNIASQLSNQLGQIGVNRAQTNAQTAEQKAQLGDSKKNLELTAKQYGIQGSQLKNALDQQLAQLGLSNYTSTEQIFGQMNSLKAQHQAQAQNLIMQALATAGYFPGGK